MPILEVERRGPLSKPEFSRLKKVLSEKGRFVKEKDRFSLIYFRNAIPKDIKDIGDEKVDLRLRITNKQPELMLKYGLFPIYGDRHREEIEIPIKLEDVEKAVDFLKYLGWHLGVIHSTKTQVFLYKEVEFAVVEVIGFDSLYEAEINVKKETEVPAALKKVASICQELGLREYKKGEFEKWCNDINNQKHLQFDFNKDSFAEMKKRFKEFF